MNSKNVTVTEGKFLSKLDKINQSSIEKTVPQAIENALNDVKIRTGIVLRFYPYIDKAKVKLDDTGKNLMCKVLHRYGGDLIDFYTPLAYDDGYDDTLHEPYIIPKSSQNVCVLNIHDKDSDEHLILGYYQNEEIVGFNPAKPGNIKIMSVCEDKNEYWIKFGKDGFNYKLPNKPNIQVGDVYDDKGVTDLDYVDSDNVYTKEEVDNLLSVYESILTDYENRIKSLEEVIVSNANPNNAENNNPTQDDTGG